MTFREAMDLCCVTPGELAAHMGVSIQAVKQARLDPDKPGHRPPPRGWQKALLELARERLPQLEDLVRELEEAEE